ncbi:hypothetical protein [Roseicyclus mahoneyensis]|jgi:hypothetical protein|uniref:Uncharacterized protein n=1 Tax=Roseicyclus mahoneyensis TaxID=164332 RepID=A0A316GRI2_9RHOB|nr:hypothetical protein [Roseicyclus mahoneyensis]PWK62642.1 hypothetical protein C7455_101671 [Roseicyclus mahoneyensis]
MRGLPLVPLDSAKAMRLMREMVHVLLLAAAGRPFLPGEDPALADPEGPIHLADRKAGLLRIDDAEGHQHPSFAKKAALGSIGQRNGSFEGISRRLEATRLPWPRIEPACVKNINRFDGKGAILPRAKCGAITQRRYGAISDSRGCEWL